MRGSADGARHACHVAANAAFAFVKDRFDSEVHPVPQNIKPN